MILNIETSSKICSVALCDEGVVVYQRQSDKEMDHSAKLAPFVDECMQQLKRHDRRLDAVAVSLGPGSYTGLRIGLSLAKGLCFGLKIPLIGVSTLELLAVKAMFSLRCPTGDEIFIPMIDARRLEVYTAAFNNRLEYIMEPQAMILGEESYHNLEGKKLICIGDGVVKAREVMTVPVEKWIEKMPLAADMTALAERCFRSGEFIDIAYSIPYYLKNFHATTPKNKLARLKKQN